MKTLPKTILAALAIGLLSCGLIQQAQAGLMDQSIASESVLTNSGGLHGRVAHHRAHNRASSRTGHHRLQPINLNQSVLAPVNPLVGNITFAGSVNMDGTSASN